MTDDKNPDAKVFPVETNFQKLARRPGGIPRDRAIEAATEKVEKLKPGFDDWMQQEVNALAAVINQAAAGEAGPGWAAEAVTHSRNLRDVGTTMGWELLTFVADSMCEILDAIEAGAQCNMEWVTCHLDALVLVRLPRYRGSRPAQVPELTNGLRRIADRVSATART